MNTDSLLDLWRSALQTMAAVSAPFLVAGLVVGLGVAVLQFGPAHLGARAHADHTRRTFVG